MVKNIGVLAAVAFVLGTQGVTAASISETRLQELMSSTSAQAVSLETLRARDREILEELARSLAERYSDVLAGSEMVFTRLSESGSIFYRLDFIGLKNRDRARAMCEVLEMERCIAKIGDDRLTVLEVRTDPIVSAIAIVEQDDVAPFDFYSDEPEPAANPRAREIEANVRSMLDPLRVYPEVRPDLARYLDPTPALKPAPSSIQAEDQDEDQASLFPLPRPDFSQAFLKTSHPSPMARPDARVASLMSSKPSHTAIFPLVRPFDQVVHLASLSEDAGPVVKRVEPASKLAATSVIEPGASGFVEVAEADPMVDHVEPEREVIVAEVAAAPARPSMTSVMRLPGLSAVDMSTIRASARQLEAARAVLPGVDAKPAMRLPQKPSADQPDPIIVDAAQEPVKPAPVPFSRSAALDDLETRTMDRAMALALDAGRDAPKPLIRELALIEIAPAPQVMTSIAALSVPQVTTTVDLVMPETPEAAPEMVEIAEIPQADDNMDIAMVAPENPEPAEVMVAEVAPEKPLMVVADITPAPEEPRRLTIEMPKEPEPAVVAEVAQEKPVNTAALKLLESTAIGSDIAQLGRVSFDDRYAKPASVDFNEGRVAGRLQKLPIRRPDLSVYRASHSAPARPILEPGSDRSAAMLLSSRVPFEVAQVPMMPSQNEDPTAPFSIEEPSSDDTDKGSMLDRLLAGQSADRPSVDLVDSPVAPMPVPSAPGKDTRTASDVPASLSVFGSEAPKPSAVPAAKPSVRPAVPAPTPQAVDAKPVLPTLNLTRDMQVTPKEAPVARPAVKLPDPAPVRANPAVVAVPEAKPQATAARAGTVPDLSGTFEAPVPDREIYLSRQIEDDAAKQRRALDALSEIVRARQVEQTAQPAQAPAPRPQALQTSRQAAAAPVQQQRAYPAADGTSQRRAYPRTENAGNRDMNAAREVSGYEASFSDDRSKMARAANPLGRVSPDERMQRHNSLAQATAPADLRIELSYVGSRDDVTKRVAELKGFFPPVMTTKGRFFGSTVPEHPDRFVVGIAANDKSARDDIIWYLEQMQIPWAIR